MADMTSETVPTQLAVDAYVRIDSILPSLRAAAEELKDKDEGKALWAATYLLESVTEKLGIATGWE